MDRVVGDAVEVFPNQNDNGTISIFRYWFIKNAPNIKNAKLLMKFLVSEYAQNFYTNNSFEYPVNTNVNPSNLISEWGDFKIDDLDLNLLGVNREKAVEIFEQSNWK